MDEQEIISQAMRALGSRKTAKKAEASRVNLEKATNSPKRATPEYREKLRAAQQARRERERQQHQAQPPPKADTQQSEGGGEEEK